MKRYSLIFGVVLILIFVEKFNAESSCTDIKDELKFDCYPRGDPNRYECVSRGCCWSMQKKSSKVPSCFYPESYKSYEIINHEKSLSGEVLYLRLIRKSIYPNDVKMLKVDISFQTSTRLRIKVNFGFYENLNETISTFMKLVLIFVR